jgi:hypothetical protein
MQNTLCHSPLTLQSSPLAQQDYQPSLRFNALIAQLNVLSYPSPLTDIVDGWLSLNEQKALYGLAYYLPGPFLEIGAWVGKSTSVIARVIRDSGQEKLFQTAELGCVFEEFRPVDGGVGFLRTAENNTMLNFVDSESWNKNFVPVLSEEGGVIGRLRKNLQAAGLSDLLEIHHGDFATAPRRPYNFIWGCTR